jgi:CDP-glucose 4,6-dehydratase
MENMVIDYAKILGKNNVYEGKRVLVTGNTGFKGSWLSLWLNNLGAKVIGYALEPPTVPSLFEICKLDKKLNSIIGDIRDYEALKSIFKKYEPEIVFHMAAQSLVRYSYKNPLETFETNIMGTANLLEVCRHTPSVKVIVNITSDKCYENQGLVRGYRESDPMGGYDPYSSSKGCAELISSSYSKSYFSPEDSNLGALLASARAGNVIGGGDWGEDRLIPDCVRALSKNKSIAVRCPDSIRPWQHILDALYGYLLLGQCLYRSDTTFVGGWNFGPDDEGVKPVRWLVDYLIEMWGDNASWAIDQNVHPYEAHCLKLDCSKAKSKLGWYPRWNLQLSIQKTIEWYKAYFKGNDMLDITINQINSYENCIKSN